MSNPVTMNPSGPPETVLAVEAPDADAALRLALDVSGEGRRAAVAAVLERWPTHLAAWAEAGDLGRDLIERYAAYRVGYHRGLDRLRQSGWRGSGYVRWRNDSNRGFLRSLHGLATTAAAIGEVDEAERCEHFLRQLDPDWPPQGL